MNFTADYANDLLRKFEDTYRSEGKPSDFIYCDPQFTRDCIEEENVNVSELHRIIQLSNRYAYQYSNRQSEIEYIRLCRQVMDESVYIRLMSNALIRRRKVLKKQKDVKESLDGLRNRLKELQVLRYAQMSGLRRFWDHSNYKVEQLSPSEFHRIGYVVKTFYSSDSERKAA